MVSTDTTDLAQHVSAHLKSHASEISEAWLSRVSDRRDDGDHQILLGHTLMLVNGVASAALEASPLLDNTAQSTLALILQMRRAQGYGLPRLVRDFDLLEEILFAEIEGAIRSYPQPVGSEAVLPLLLRLALAVGALSRGSLEVATERLQRDAAQRVQQYEHLSNSLNHELRNRLNTAHILIDRYKTESLYQHRSSILVDYLTRIQERLESVKSVVDDVFSVEIAEHRLDANSHAANHQPLSVVINNVCDDAQEQARERGVLIIVSGALPDFLVDATRVRLILINLLSNAIKYSDSGRADRFAEVSVAASAGQDGEWQIGVTDNGIGIPPEDQARIFRRYGRALTKEPGQGLGLFLAREAVIQLGGRMWVESAPGQGSTFYFTLREPTSRAD